MFKYLSHITCTKSKTIFFYLLLLNRLNYTMVNWHNDINKPNKKHKYFENYPHVLLSEIKIVSVWGRDCLCHVVIMDRGSNSSKQSNESLRLTLKVYASLIPDLILWDLESDADKYLVLLITSLLTPKSPLQTQASFWSEASSSQPAAGLLSSKGEACSSESLRN